MTGIPPLGKLYDLGLDGRLYVDLSELHELAKPPTHFVRTRCPDLLDRQKPWRVEIKGQVERPKHMDLADLEQLTTDLPPTLMECAGNSARPFAHARMVWLRLDQMGGCY